MTSFIIGVFLKKIFKSQIIYAKIATELLSIILTMYVIYYASEAFTLKSSLLTGNRDSLFTFLLIGEVSTVLPMSLAQKWLNSFLDLRHQHFYQTLIGLRLSPSRFAFFQTVSESLFPLLRIFLILLSGFIIKKFDLSIVSFLGFVLVQALGTVTFFFMALITSSIYLKFNRGVGAFYTFQSVAAILAGTYFPTIVFPQFVKNISLVLPQTQILIASRALLDFHQPLNLVTVLSLAGWPILLFLVWYFLDRSVSKSLKKKARYF